MNSALSGGVGAVRDRGSLRKTKLVSEGHRNERIAALLGISEETVPVHLKSIFAKLKVNERTAAVNAARDRAHRVEPSGNWR